MKKQILGATTIALLLSVSMLNTGCKKEATDTNKPILVVVGSNPYYVQKNPGANFVDPGATATDDIDGSILPSSSGAVSLSNTGTFTIAYTARDKAGNVGGAARSVVVVDINGHYATAVDESPYPGGTISPYSEDMYLSTDGSGKVSLTKFGDYNNGSVYFNLTSPTTLKVPSQTVTCGTAPDNIQRTFSGTGTISATSPNITIDFTEVNANGTGNSQDRYTR